MTEVYVTTNTVCDHSEYSDEQYGDWRADYTFEVTGITLQKPSGDYEKFNTAFEVNAGDTLFVLSIIYSTGDSFGYSTGNGEALWVFKDFEVAKKATEDFRSQEDEYSVKFKDESGKKLTMSNPASGYFESLTDVMLQSFAVGTNSQMRF